jgi:hypothetical protein
MTFLQNFSCVVHGAMMRVEDRRTWSGFKTLVCTGCERDAFFNAFTTTDDQRGQQ